MKLKKDFGVRALLASIVVSGAVLGGLYLIIQGNAELGMGFLGSAAMAAIGFYFGQRDHQPPPAVS